MSLGGNTMVIMKFAEYGGKQKSTAPGVAGVYTSKHKPGLTSLDFGDRARTGIFNMVLP